MCLLFSHHFLDVLFGTFLDSVCCPSLFHNRISAILIFLQIGSSILCIFRLYHCSTILLSVFDLQVIQLTQQPSKIFLFIDLVKTGKSSKLMCCFFNRKFLQTIGLTKPLIVSNSIIFSRSIFANSFSLTFAQLFSPLLTEEKQYNPNICDCVTQ